MAVIITNMDMPKNCFTVENTRFKYCKLYDVCEHKDIRCGNIPSDCPLKSADEMIAEIKDRRSKHNCSCSDCLDIIDKYTKEQNNE